MNYIKKYFNTLLVIVLVSVGFYLKIHNNSVSRNLISDNEIASIKNPISFLSYNSLLGYRFQQIVVVTLIGALIYFFVNDKFNKLSGALAFVLFYTSFWPNLLGRQINNISFLLLGIVGLYFSISKIKSDFKNTKNLIISTCLLVLSVFLIAVFRKEIDFQLASITEALENFGRIWQYLFFNQNSQVAYGLAGQPLLGSFIAVMFVLGVIVSLVRFKKSDYQSLVFVWMFLTIFTAFSQKVLTAKNIYLLLPSIFIFAGIGSSYLINIWKENFPINKPARYFGVVLVYILIFANSFLTFTQIFVAWTGDIKVKSEFNQNLGSFSENFKKSVHDSDEVYVMAPEKWHNYIELVDDNIKFITADELTSLPLVSGKREFYVINDMDQSEKSLEVLKAKYNNPQVQEFYSDLGLTTDFWYLAVDEISQ